MLKTGDSLYLRFFEDSDVRILHKSTVANISDLGPAIEVDKPDPRLQAGAEVIVYYETSAGFVQQVARIERVERSEATPLVQLAITSDSTGADARVHRRVRGPFKGVVLTLDGEECVVQDLSEVGFAVTSQQSFTPGQIVAVSLGHEGVEYRGRARIRSFSAVAGPHRSGQGLSRYGLLVELSEAGETLPDGLRALGAFLSED